MFKGLFYGLFCVYILFLMKVLQAKENSIEQLLRRVNLSLIHRALTLDLVVPKLLRQYVKIEDSFVVQSFAERHYWPTKKIKITWGMLNFVHNEDELAGVLAHEIAHTILKNEKNKFQSEFSADKLATYLIHHAGYHPHALKDVLLRVSTNEEYVIAEEGQNHPPIGERIASLADYLKERGVDRKSPKDPVHYRTMLGLKYRNTGISRTEYHHKILDKIAPIAEQIDDLDKIKKKEKFTMILDSLRKLSNLMAQHEYLRFRPQKSVAHSHAMLLGRKFVQRFPSWMRDEHVLRAKLHRLYLKAERQLFSISDAVGDAMHFYEVLEGKSFFMGKYLDEDARIEAGVFVLKTSPLCYKGPYTLVEKIIADLPSLSGESQQYFRMAKELFLLNTVSAPLQ